MHGIISYANSESLTYFPIWIPFTSLSSLIAVAGNSKIMLNKSVESEHSCLVPDVRGDDFSFSQLNMILAVGLSYMALLCQGAKELEKTLESPLDSKEIQPVHPKGNKSWIFIGRTDAEAETQILWPPDAKILFF